jgi:hypothetical protein
VGREGGKKSRKEGKEGINGQERREIKERKEFMDKKEGKSRRGSYSWTRTEENQEKEGIHKINK